MPILNVVWWFRKILKGTGDRRVERPEEERIAATQQASDYITSCCPKMGAFYSSDAGSVTEFLRNVARDMDESVQTPTFPGRYKEHVVYALDMVADHGFTSSPAAIASAYLATRFEFYFRMLSGKLDGGGRWTSAQVQTDAREAIQDRRLGSDHITSVALAYKIMKLDQSKRAVQIFNQLDQALPSHTVPDGPPITDIGVRIAYLRNASGHGEWGDISSESIFYALVTAIVFYNQD